MTGAAFVIFMIVSPLVNGYVLATMWRWIVSPTFGLPTLSIPAAWGLMLVAALFQPTAQATKSDKPFSEVVIHGYALLIAKLAISLPLAWVAKTWMEAAR